MIQSSFNSAILSSVPKGSILDAFLFIYHTICGQPTGRGMDAARYDLIRPAETFTESSEQAPT